MPLCLIVDDSAVVRKISHRMAEGLGFTVKEAENGEKALVQCKGEMPDFILLDWNMPVMDGIEFLKHLRLLQGGEKPKVIFCTTENDFAHITRALEAGANEYVMKPFDETILKNKLSQLGML